MAKLIEFTEADLLTCKICGNYIPKKQHTSWPKYYKKKYCGNRCRNLDPEWHKKINTPESKQKRIDSWLKTVSKTGYPFLGKKHTDEWKREASRRTREAWQKMTPEQRREFNKKFAANGLKKLSKMRYIERTSIEKDVHNVLLSAGVHFGWQCFFSGWRVDFYLPEKRLMIECNGCYWHGCKECGYEKYNLRKQLRDSRLSEYAQKNGYNLIWLWEHEIKQGAFQALKRRGVI